MSVYDYRIGVDSGNVAGTGTVTVLITTNLLVGASTLFTTELHVGDVIIADSNGSTASVASISDNTHAVLSTYPTPFLASAFHINRMTNVETLGTGLHFAPKSSPKPWFEALDIGDGLARGMGRPVTTWQFGFVTQSFRDALRVYCPTKSARVYIRTRDIDSADGYNTYQAAMLWPDLEQRDATRRLSFAIEIRDMVLL